MTPAVLADLTDACGEEPGQICEWAYDQWGSEFWAGAADWAVEKPLTILLLLAVAFVISRILRRAVRGFARRLGEVSDDERLNELRQSGAGRYIVAGTASVRARARAETVGSVLSSIVTATVWVVAGLLILGEVNIDLAPLLAGAGIAGVALGFGAQTIVRDFLSGMFMLIEDQFGVGDVIDVGETTGSVEKVSLRTTTLRDVNGTVWHVPNCEIHRVANKSQVWSRAVLDIEVAYEADLRLAEGVIQRAADDMWEDPEWRDDELLERPEVWGVQSLGADGVSIRVVAKTSPAQQFEVERELRLRIKEALDTAGIEIPYPQRTIWVRNQGEHPPASAPDPATVRTAETPRFRASVEVENDDGER
jgi:small conductance mechanosensitive channel